MLAGVLCAPTFSQIKNPNIVLNLIKAYSKVIDQMKVQDLIQIFDALYKSQLDTVGDHLMDQFLHKFLTQLNVGDLRQLPVSSVLRLYRGFAICNKETISVGLHAELLKNIREFIIKLEPDMSIDHNMWLTIADTAQRTLDIEIAELAL